VAGEHQSPIRIIIADDHELLRTGLRCLLETKSNFAVISEAADGIRALTETRRLKPDVLLLDLSMPNGSGLDVLKELGKSEHPRIIVLTAAIGKRETDEVLGLGAAGVVLKGALTAQLFQAIDTVVAGDIWSFNKAIKRKPAEKKATKRHGRT
jgi:DNA-binding NarL/FixJ family response regulator